MHLTPQYVILNGPVYCTDRFTKPATFFEMVNTSIPSNNITVTPDG